MKKLLLIFFGILLFSGCTSDDSDELFVKKASVIIDRSEVDNCLYTIRTEDEENFTTDWLPGNYQGASFEAEITYRITDGEADCGFGGILYKIKIVELVKL